MVSGPVRWSARSANWSGSRSCSHPPRSAVARPTARTTSIDFGRGRGCEMVRHRTTRRLKEQNQNFWFLSTIATLLLSPLQLQGTSTQLTVTFRTLRRINVVAFRTQTHHTFRCLHLSEPGRRIRASRTEPFGGRTCKKIFFGTVFRQNC